MTLDDEPAAAPDDEPAAPDANPASELGDLYMACFKYESAEEGDLTFDLGEVILVEKMEAEWWTGRIGQDRQGVFPYNYVEALKDGVPAAESTAPAAAASDAPQEEVKPVAAETAEEPKAAEVAAAAPAAPVATSTSKSTKKKKKDDGGKKLGLAKVVAPYEATSKEQLSLNRGQMVLIRKKTETGWWQGEIQASGGKKRQVGWFPASYVKMMADSKEEKKDAVAVSSGPMLKALFPYQGQQEDELNFDEGAIIKLVSKEEEAWWKGELDGKVGVFPSNYVEEIQ